MIGEKIKKIRVEYGLTQKQLGQRCGISQVQIARYEKGVNKPSRRIIEKISAGLEIPISYFDTSFSINDSVLDAAFFQLKEVLVDEGDKFALFRLMKSLYSSCQSKITMEKKSCKA